VRHGRASEEVTYSHQEEVKLRILLGSGLGSALKLVHKNKRNTIIKKTTPLQPEAPNQATTMLLTTHPPKKFTRCCAFRSHAASEEEIPKMVVATLASKGTCKLIYMLGDYIGGPHTRTCRGP